MRIALGLILLFVSLLSGGATSLAAPPSPLLITVVPAGEKAGSAATDSRQTTETLQAALDLTRRLRRSDPLVSVTIALAPGTHRLSEPVRFGPGDGGTRSAPLVIRGAADGSTRLVGSVTVQPSSDAIPADLLARLPPASRAHVRAYRLPAGATVSERIQEPRLLHSRDAPVALQVYDAQGTLWPARWPNRGFASVTTAASSDAERDFLLAGGQASRWRDEPDLWAEGYWHWDWLFESLPVTGVDAASGRLTLATRPHDGIVAKARFRIAHALSELDEAGEWWRDAGWGLLLAWPRDTSGDLDISVTDSLIVVDGASHLRFESLVLEQTNGTLVRIDRANDVVISRSILRRAAGRAVSIDASMESGIVGSTVSATGIGAVRLVGGDRATLKPAGLFVRDCRLTDYAGLARTQSPAITVDGVGQSVEGNLFHDTDEYAIHLRGNDHNVAGNELARLLAGSTDTGAIYAGRDWTARGSVIAHNFLHDIRAAPGFEVKGVYLDDMASGFTVRANLFLRTEQPVFLGGGRDNLVEGNVFVDSSPAVHLDARGRSWAAGAVTDPDSEIRAALAAMPVGSKLWRRRFPNLANLLREDPAAPRGNRVIGNVMVRSDLVRRQDSARADDIMVQDNRGPEGVRLAQPAPPESGDADPSAYDVVLGNDGARIAQNDFTRMRRSAILRQPFAR